MSRISAFGGIQRSRLELILRDGPNIVENLDNKSYFVDKPDCVYGKNELMSPGFFVSSKMIVSAPMLYVHDSRRTDISPFKGFYGTASVESV